MARWIISMALVVVLSGLISAKAWADEKKGDWQETKIKMEDCPKPVQETIKKEMGTGTLGEMVKETGEGKTMYEADTTIDGKSYEIKVAEDGTLISKKLEQEDKDGKEDKKEDKEGKDKKD